VFRSQISSKGALTGKNAERIGMCMNVERFNV
jgi:hypothetical protein